MYSLSKKLRVPTKMIWKVNGENIQKKNKQNKDQIKYSQLLPTIVSK